LPTPSSALPGNFTRASVSSTSSTFDNGISPRPHSVRSATLPSSLPYVPCVSGHQEPEPCSCRIKRLTPKWCPVPFFDSDQPFLLSELQRTIEYAVSADGEGNVDVLAHRRGLAERLACAARFTAYGG
jgi:hypothetical protein